MSVDEETSRIVVLATIRDVHRVLGQPNRDLDALADRYDPSDPTQSFDWYLKRFQAEVIVDHLGDGDVLDLGCATGELAALLRPYVRGRYHIVEAVQVNIDRAVERLPDAEFTCTRWEDAQLVAGRYSDIIASGALEHAEYPHDLLVRLLPAVAPAGRLHVIVPNGHSLHRQLGVEMGLQDRAEDLTESDRAQGHYRNYTRSVLYDELKGAGWEPIRVEGVGLKPLPGPRMLDWPVETLSALNRLARKELLRGCAAEIYATARSVPIVPLG